MKETIQGILDALEVERQIARDDRRKLDVWSSRWDEYFYHERGIMHSMRAIILYAARELHIHGLTLPFEGADNCGQQTAENQPQGEHGAVRGHHG